MRRRWESTPLRDRLGALARSLTLTGPEQAMVAAILLSMLVGAIVMNYRREYRLQHPIEAAPASRHGWESPGGR